MAFDNVVIHQVADIHLLVKPTLEKCLHLTTVKSLEVFLSRNNEGLGALVILHLAMETVHLGLEIKDVVFEAAAEHYLSVLVPFQ